MGWLTAPFADPIGRRALAEVLILALACGPLGVWVVLHRQSYAAESAAHAMLPGLVAAALIGAPLLLGAAAGVLVGAAATALAARDERLGSDVAVGVAVSALFGLGAGLALVPAAPPRLNELLFGDLLGVSAGDLVTAAILVAITAGALVAGHRGLVLAAFDRGSAAALGARPRATGLLLLVLIALASVATVQALGNLLGVALLLAPGAAALNLTRRLGAALVAAVALAAVAGVAGLVVSYRWNVAAGAAVALCAVALFLLSLVVSPRAAGARATRRRAGASGSRWRRTTGRWSGSWRSPRTSATR
jgi:ABC-type Mn2+/Zn2+ transport system permease subunit